MSAKQMIVQGRGPSNINLASLFTPLMFAGVHNLLTMFREHSFVILPNKCISLLRAFTEVEYFPVVFFFTHKQNLIPG